MMIFALHPLQVKNIVCVYSSYNKFYPDLNDFNNTNTTVIFEPNEDAAMYEKNAPIFVTDDAINKAIEQVFVVSTATCR